MIPAFPNFKLISLDDRDEIQRILWDYQPATSELTFTNLFIWRDHYGITVSLFKDWLLFYCEKTGYGLLPVGPAGRSEVTLRFIEYISGKNPEDPRLERVDQRLTDEIAGFDVFSIEESRDHFDYVYSKEALITLEGRKYHSKRNYVNTFKSTYQFSYHAVGENDLKGCLELADQWCRVHRCKEDMNLLGDLQATHEAIRNFKELRIQGGVIEIGGKIEAFTFGELLNKETAVIHIEKANHEVRGIYAMINQLFVANCWNEVKYINREQDLGEDRLRKAKLSYHPDHFVKKYTVRLKR